MVIQTLDSNTGDRNIQPQMGWFKDSVALAVQRPKQRFNNFKPEARTPLKLILLMDCWIGLCHGDYSNHE